MKTTLGRQANGQDARLVLRTIPIVLAGVGDEGQVRGTDAKEAAAEESAAVTVTVALIDREWRVEGHAETPDAAVTTTAVRVDLALAWDTQTGEALLAIRTIIVLATRVREGEVVVDALTREAALSPGTVVLVETALWSAKIEGANQPLTAISAGLTRITWKTRRRQTLSVPTQKSHLTISGVCAWCQANAGPLVAD